MNVRVHQDTHSLIVDEAEKRYGSRKKMGQALDEIVREWAGNEDTEVLQRLENIEEMLESGVSPSTHTGGSSTIQTGVDEDLLEAIESGTVDPDEFNLAQLKGEDSSLVVDAIIGVLRHRGERTYSKKDVGAIIEDEIGYSVNAARQKRDKVLREMVDMTPDIDDEIETALRDEFNEDLWYNKNGNGEWTVPKKSSNPIQTWLNKYGSLDDFLPETISGEGYVLPERKDEIEGIRKSQLNHLMKKALEDGDTHKAYGLQVVSDALEVGIEFTHPVAVSDIY